jgi:hypothetical protein
MEISYLSPCKGSLVIAVTPFHHLEPGSSLRNRHHSPRHGEEQETDGENGYRPVTEPIDTFRVVIRRGASQTSGSDKSKAKKSQSQTFVQGMIILY